VLIKELSNESLTDVFQLSNIVFGSNFLNISYYHSFIDSITKKIYTASIGNQIVGFISISNSKQINKTLLKGTIDIDSEVTIIKQVVVHPNFQNRGIGMQLVRVSIQKINQQKICIAWKRGEHIALGNILIKNGFKKIKAINKYWYDDSILKQYNCPECGNPCFCDAIIYIL